jgi:signal transduction histidine kinase
MAVTRTGSGLISSTPGRLVIAIVAVLAAAVAGLGWLVVSQTNALLIRQVAELVAQDAEAVKAEVARGGPEALAAATSERIRRDPQRLYILLDPSRSSPTTAPPGIVLATQEHGPEQRRYLFHFHRSEADGERLAAGVALPLDHGRTLIVGRDIEAVKAHVAGVQRLLLAGIVGLSLLAVAGGLLVSRNLLRRVENINASASAIMAGEFSRRIPLANSGDELDQVAANLNAMLDRIEQLMAGLREVSDNIAHDLKTPLTRLRNRAETALRDAASGGPGAASALRLGLERTIEEADDLIKTFNALLLIARLEAGAASETFEIVDVTAIARDVAELYEPVAEQAGLDLVATAAPGSIVRGNRGLIGQAIANLVDNAIKYSHETTGNDRSVTLAVTRSGDAVEIAVADHGPGIKPEDRERVLKRFVRLEASRTQPGTGLGLSLVAAVARLHSGSVRLEDNEPGLRVVVSLPVSA